MNDNDQIQEMRSQMDALRHRLQQSEIINEKQLAGLCRRDRRMLNLESASGILAAALVIIFIFQWFLPHGYTLPYCIATCLIMTGCAAYTAFLHIRANRTITRCINESDLLSLCHTMRQLKKSYRDWRYVSIPLALVWFSWTICESVRLVPDAALLRSMVIGLLVGGTIGGTIGHLMNRKVISACDEIILSIEGPSGQPQEDQKS